MTETHYDLAVIGGGPGGYAAALRGAQLKARTVLIEKSELGGTCLNEGCVPTKALLSSADIYQKVKQAGLYGVDVGKPAVNMPRMLERKEAIIKELRGGVHLLLRERSVEIVNGTAEFVKPGEILVETPDGEQRVTAEKVILAAGSESLIPPVQGLAEAKRAITSREALKLAELPAKMAVLGGGIIGLEFASLYHRLGVKVTVIEMLPGLAAGMDEEITVYYEEVLKQQGIAVHTGARLVSYGENEQGCRLVIQKGDEEFNLEADLLLLATGRSPVTQNLAARGFKLAGRALAVDSKLQTSIPGVYACGDMIGGKMLAHVAFAEGFAAAENAMGKNSSMDYRAIPSCLYSKPEVGAVGLTEKEALEKGYDLKVGRFPFSSNGKALAMGEGEGFIKIISEKKYQEILGVHIVGPAATELIGEAVLAMNLEGTAEELASTIHAHPTLSEGMMEAAHIIMGTPLHSL